jgi:hypothetical protein
VISPFCLEWAADRKLEKYEKPFLPEGLLSNMYGLSRVCIRKKRLIYRFWIGSETCKKCAYAVVAEFDRGFKLALDWEEMEAIKGWMI